MMVCYIIGINAFIVEAIRFLSPKLVKFLF